MQDPPIAPPPRKKCPNFKVGNFSKCIHYIYLESWILGKSISGDEQTVVFKGQHDDKLHINLKKLGDGFQADSF